MQQVPTDVIKHIQRRLCPDAWEILDARIAGAFKVVASVRRRKDGALYTAELNLMGGELNLKRVGR